MTAGLHDPKPDITYRRPWTMPVRNGGSTRFVVKRACDGCGELIGDTTTREIATSIKGLPLMSVVNECPFCTPSEPEAATS